MRFHNYDKSEVNYLMKKQSLLPSTNRDVKVGESGVRTTSPLRVLGAILFDGLELPLFELWAVRRFADSINQPRCCVAHFVAKRVPQFLCFESIWGPVMEGGEIRTFGVHNFCSQLNGS